MNDPVSNKTESTLPHGWRLATLGEIARVFSGSSAPQGKDFFAESGAPFVRVSDLSNCNAAGILLETRDRLSENAIANCSLVKAPQGAVVFPKSGAAIATNRRAVLGMDAYIVGHLISLVAKQDVVLTEWLYSAMRQIDMMEHSENSGYPSLKKSAVEKIRITLPPLAEQKRIVAVLNKQMAAIEKARAAALERVEAIRALPSAFLREIFPLGDGGLPHGWQWVALGDVCEIAGEYGSGARRVNFDGAVRYVRITDIDNYGKLKESNPVSPSTVEPRYFLQKEDLLFARSGSVGRCYLHQLESGKYQYAGYLIRYRALSNVLLPKYMFYVAQSAYWQQWVATQSKTATLANINAKQFSSFKIPLPALAEQKRIVATLNEKMATAEKARVAAEAELEAITALPSAVLRQAFSGNL